MLKFICRKRNAKKVKTNYYLLYLSLSVSVEKGIGDGGVVRKVCVGGRFELSWT